ncbi:MAG: hypothetical protein Q9196_006210 [Gyalolechia fulgens]
MGCKRRPCIIEDSLDNRLVTFPDETQWQLTSQLSEKSWDGSDPEGREDKRNWVPSEAHAVYECVQLQGPRPSTVAIMKIRIEVPFDLPPSTDPAERAKEASGMRLNYATKQETEALTMLTAAGCSATPTLLAVKIDVQDESVLRYSSGETWWMPGGYIVYILMEKLSAQPLDYGPFWNKFTSHDRDEVRSAFKKAYIEVRMLGFLHEDCKISNLMWDKAAKKCYIIDWELANYDPAKWANPEKIWSDREYFRWDLARRGRGEPQW